MQVFINSEAKEIPDNCMMSELIQSLALGDIRFAVEVNEELVPRSTFEQHRLTAGDKIEIVQAIGGG